MTDRLTTADVAVAGGGPAGWAVARACADRGLRVVLADPRPDRAWRQTYGSWAHELPPELPSEVFAASGTGTAIARRAHRLDDRYVVLDTGALQDHLRDPVVTTHAGRAVGLERAGTSAASGGVVLADGRVIIADVIVDATGSAQALSSQGPSTPGPSTSGPSTSGPSTIARRDRPAEQTAYGVVVDDAVAARVTDGRLLFMDWRARHGHAGWATFLYAVPVGDGRTLLEETSLVRRPGLPIAELRSRLCARLRAAGVPRHEIPVDASRTETVRFPVDTPVHRAPPHVLAVGAAAPVMHPASGFSVATALRQAPRVAEALAAPGGPESRAAAARRVVRSPSAATVHAMRRRGLDVLLRLPPADVPDFFEAFFTLSAQHRRAYLDAREDVTASLTAMLALFARLPPRLRGHLMVGSIVGPRRVRMDDTGVM